MSARGAFVAFAAALLIVVPASAAEVTDLTGEEPTSEALIRALEIASDAPPDAINAVAVLVRFDGARLTDQAQQTVVALAQAISSPELSDQHVQVEGYTDASGAADFNQRLSEERAAAVYGYLVNKGIDPLRLSKVGFGEEQPMPGSDPNDVRNRRVQIASWMLGQPEEVSAPGQVPSLQISLDYQIHLKRPDGSHGVVDPTESPFMTGDRVYLTFESSMTGIFDAYSVTPAGDVTELGSWTVDRAQDIRLPPAPDVIGFEGVAGTQLLVLQYHPCETARTRVPDLGQEVFSALPDCTDLPQRAFQADRSRDLAVDSDDEGSSTTIVVPVDGVPAAALRGLSLAIPLAHR